MQFTEQELKQARHFLKRAYEEISWESVFEGSIVKCKRCLNTIKASALQRNLHINEGISNWSLKIAIEAKELANDPNWFCHHPPEETYFVRAILMGVKELMDIDKVKSKCGHRKEQTVRDKTRNK